MEFAEGISKQHSTATARVAHSLSVLSGEKTPGGGYVPPERTLFMQLKGMWISKIILPSNSMKKQEGLRLEA